MTMSAVPPRRRRAMLLGAVAGALLAPWGACPAQAQDRTVVVGSPSAAPVTVDLSVLDAGSGTTGTYGDLLFPGSRYKPGQRVVLRPPGMVADRPVLRPPGQTRAPRRALASRPATRPAPAPVARRQPPSQPAPVARRRPPSNTPPPPPQIAMPAPAPTPAPAPRRTATPTPPSDAALAAIKPAAGPRAASQPTKPPLAAPQIKKRASTPPTTQAAIPPVPSAPPPAPSAKSTPARSAPSAADIPPPPPVPAVNAAPRVPVTAKPAPAPKAAPTPKTQVAGIPRNAWISKGGKQQIVFAPGSSELGGAGKATLAAVAKSLAEDSARRVELRAYARGDDNNVSQARRLSLSRALAIRSALIAEGVKPTRIDVRALGNRVPSGIPNRVDLTVFTR